MKKYILTLTLMILGVLKISAQVSAKENTEKEDIQTLIEQEDIQTLIEMGITLHDERKYKEAIEIYKEALKIDPKSMYATYEMSLSYLSLRDYKNASLLSAKVINSKDKDLMVGAYGVKSESLTEMGEADKAINLLEDALRSHGDNYYLHFNLALIYFKKGNLNKTITQVDKALDLNKSQSGAYLLSAYALKDLDIWVQSILSFHVFLMLEPDSHRSKNAFEEMLQLMQVKETTKEPVERSFIQQQLQRKLPPSDSIQKVTPSLAPIHGINRELIYNSLIETKDSLKIATQKSIGIDSTPLDSVETDLYITFKEMTRTLFTVLSKENDGTKNDFIWNFHVPIVTKILNSAFFDIYCRYISVAYFPESLEWWENNQEDAAKFVRWFEKGDEDE